MRYKDNVYLRTLKRIIYYIEVLKITHSDAVEKQEIFGKYEKSNSDTGSTEAQIASFSYCISHLTEHVRLSRKGYSIERTLTMLVAKRRRLLNYLESRDITRYCSTVKELGLHK